MWGFEKKFVHDDEIDYGPLPHRYINHTFLATLACLWFLLAANILLIGGLETQAILVLGVSAVVFARLAATDLTYLLLLNIYTAPMFLLGLMYQGFMGIGWVQSLLGSLVAAGIGLVISFIMSCFNKQTGEFGFGDVKMLAVMGAWVGLGLLPFAFSVAFIANLILAFCISKNKALPFGFGLVMGTWAMVAFEKPFMDALFYLFV